MKQKFWNSALITVVTIIVFGLPSSGSAQSCQQWELSGNLSLVQANLEYYLWMRLQQSGTNISGTAEWTKRGDDNGIWVDDLPTDTKGVVDGTLVGTRLSLKVRWDDRKVGVYEGEIAPNGRINGFTYELARPNHKAQWYSRNVAKCVRTPPARPGGVTRAIGKKPSQSGGRIEARPEASEVTRVIGRTTPVVGTDDARACKIGFVWREALANDYVCVTPQARDRVAAENRTAASRRNPNGAYGPNSCKPGYVWREAFAGDTVCVTPEIRGEVQRENRLAASRMARP